MTENENPDIGETILETLTEAAREHPGAGFVVGEVPPASSKLSDAERQALDQLSEDYGTAVN